MDFTDFDRIDCLTKTYKQTNKQPFEMKRVYLCVNKKKTEQAFLLLFFYSLSLTHTHTHHFMAATHVMDSFSRKKYEKIEMCCVWNIPLELSMPVCVWVSDVLKYACIRVKMCTSSQKTMLLLGNNQREKNEHNNLYFIFIIKSNSTLFVLSLSCSILPATVLACMPLRSVCLQIMQILPSTYPFVAIIYL